MDKNLVGKDVLQTLETSIKKDLRMRRGNIKENSNLDVIQKKKNISVGQRNSQMYTKELHRTDKYAIMIRGKVDGVSEGIIVESKNRTSRLFNELRQYEQVQLEAYMFLTDMKEALLTEHYNDTSNEIPYTHDNEFWSACVESIIGFIDTHMHNVFNIQHPPTHRIIQIEHKECLNVFKQWETMSNQQLY